LQPPRAPHPVVRRARPRELCPPVQRPAMALLPKHKT